ncbi:MAG: ATP-grasp domain-containing protein, partial [Gammaproteobacteria bacterium]|nr:ATP-grasp domain-containing protein [Gammaproteobacteria bacterium]
MAAARRLGIDLLVASEGEHALAGVRTSGIVVSFSDPAASLTAVQEANRQRPFAGVIGTDDASIELAAEASARFGLPHNPPLSVRFTRRKDLARARLAACGVPVPRHWTIDLDSPLAGQLAAIRYPCVAKPVALSASRGVIRADDKNQLLHAISRIGTILQHAGGGEESKILLIEEFVPGAEVAVEGLLYCGRLDVLAIFDKPDPLDGPFFEETYYITPSRHSPVTQEKLKAVVAEACDAFGLREGPIHAECRINSEGVWVLEVAARTIGGLCGRLLKFGTGHGLEELVLGHALGHQILRQGISDAAGVLMIPIPQAGILRRVEGVLAAQQVPYVEEVVIDVREGYELVPLPDGSSYLGFIFSRAPTPAEAEDALRMAHARLQIVV